MYKLRDYQARVKRELYDWFANHPKGFPIVDACVGAGKSIIIADLCKDMIEKAPDTRIIMCVASRELCEQNMQKLLAIWPDAPAGICSAALGSKDTDSQIIFATIGTLARRVDELGTVDVMIIDECHNINTANTGMYRKMIETLQDTTSPHMAVIGFTGTPFRGNGVWLWQGKDPIFEGVASRVTMDELLKLGYLAPLVVEPMEAKIDTADVKITAGDYNSKQLSELLDDKDLARACVDDLYIRGQGRKKWLIFCHSIEHANLVLNEVRSFDVTAEMVIGETPSDSREKILKAYKMPYDHSDAINILVNVGVLTTGFDAPMIDLIALLRPTKSPVLYVQMAGRGMRIAEGKTDCLWLDYTSTTYELGPVNTIRGRNASPKGETAKGEPCKHCSKCGEKNPVYMSDCLSCGEPFSPNQSEKAVGNQSGNAEIIDDGNAKWANVTGLGYVRHTSRKSGKSTLRVDYYTDLQIHPISEYICIEHEGYAFDKACQWWREHNLGPVPTSIDDALHLLHASSLNRPAKIEVKRDGKFWKVIGREFGKVSEIYSLPPIKVQPLDDMDDMPF